MTSLSQPLRRESARGILFLMIGVAIFSIQDLILKWLAGDYPLHQAMVLRSLTALPLLLILARYDGGIGALFTAQTRAMVVRGLVMFLAYFAYYIALPALPLATTVALYFSAPLFITVLSVVILKETVGPRRWMALVLGFAGVVIMVRPGSTLFDWAALLPVASGCCYALSMISARRLGETESAPALAFWGNAVFLVLALLISAVFGSGAFEGASHPSLAFLTRGWVWPTLPDLLLMMLTGIVAAVGLTCLTQAYRIAEASVVTPFEYTAMIWGVLWGWLVWRDWPDAAAWAGITVICGAGLYILWREKAAVQDG